MIPTRSRGLLTSLEKTPRGIQVCAVAGCLQYLRCPKFPPGSCAGGQVEGTDLQDEMIPMRSRGVLTASSLEKFPRGVRGVAGPSCGCPVGVPAALPCPPSPPVPADCAGCKEEIKQGQSLLALEKQWHVSCFKCQTCGIILTGEYISK